MSKSKKDIKKMTAAHIEERRAKIKADLRAEAARQSKKPADLSGLTGYSAAHIGRALNQEAGKLSLDLVIALTKALGMKSI